MAVLHGVRRELAVEDDGPVARAPGRRARVPLGRRCMYTAELAVQVVKEEVDAVLARVEVEREVAGEGQRNEPVGWALGPRRLVLGPVHSPRAPPWRCLGVQLRSRLLVSCR